MLAPPSAAPLMPTLLPHAVPLLFLCGALLAGRPSVAPAVAWARARITAAAAVVAAIGALLAAATTAGGWEGAPAAVLLLVAFVGWVLTRFSGTYLAGEHGQPRFVRWLLGTLAGSSLVVATGHFGVLVLAWLGTSLSLQQLLTFYGDRPAARLAAHKKFLVSRLADVCMLAAAVLLQVRFHTLATDSLVAAVAGGADPGPLGRTAVVLVVVATLLKSAQLPFHGWLMQVMEAPTPVSALLHAGVVNLGGYVLIRLHPMVDAVPAAQILLVVSGSLTAALAALVASTRISVKVALAWSTCAQMGFMVLQCGLGLHQMALLHLIAHSLYKANAFLEAGSAPHVAAVAGLAPRAVPATVGARVVALVAGGAAVWLASRGFGVSLAAQPAVAAMAVIVALAQAPLLIGGARGIATTAWLPRLAAPAAVVFAWFALHHAMHGWLGDPLASSPLTGVLAAWAAACFLLVFVVQTLAAMRPDHTVVRRLHAWFFGGLHLDEWFTRLTLRLWPDRAMSTRPAVDPSLPPTRSR